MNFTLLTASFGILLLLQTSLHAQTLALDPIGVGPAVTITGNGGPVSSSVELQQFLNRVIKSSPVSVFFPKLGRLK